jgi:hypothetical protein
MSADKNTEASHQQSEMTAPDSLTNASNKTAEMSGELTGEELDKVAGGKVKAGWN